MTTNNTKITVTGETTVITLHQTDIVTVTPDFIRLNTGGWNTVTTRARMNQASQELGLGFRVYQKAGSLYVDNAGITYPMSQTIAFAR